MMPDSRLKEIFGMKVVVGDFIPVIEVEYEYLHPVINGHVWVKMKIKTTNVIVFGDWSQWAMAKDVRISG